VGLNLTTMEIRCTLQNNHGVNEMDGTVRGNIKPGSKVRVVKKQDQRSGKLTEDIALKVLTNSQTDHQTFFII